ncbi:organic solute transporter alpha-like protein 2 [Acanthaster planci]|uniref:Organic solute transporter alpha-like protein 2 n=1 Tax=Acanthaster planci TaxID=133434 RepID=A0A8B7ZGQ1_ACAPL|nr:organic solute transporter alpha-like protein 2 [Acanthaster planci]
MGALLGIPQRFCPGENETNWADGSLTSELAKYPLFTLLFSYAAVASFTVIVIFLEAAFFTATRVPRSSVANHRLNTVIMMSAFPAFVLLCLPAVLIPSSAGFCLALQDLYYSFVMFKFIVLQVDYYGGHRKMMARLAAEKVMFNINVPILCCLFCLKPVRLTRKSFTTIKILVLQTSILKPIMTFFRAIAGFANVNLLGVPDLILQALTVVSTMTAVTGMNMLTKASSSKDLEKYDLPAKNQLMTAGLLMNGLQPTLISLGTVFRPLGCFIPFPSPLLASQWQAFLVILESTLIMIPVLRYYRTADSNVVGVPPPIEEDEEEPTTQLGKMRQWIRRHTLM